MMALMLAPAYKSFDEYQGFGKKGSTLGVVVFAVISVLSYLLVNYFAGVNKKKNEISIAAKKKADAKVFGDEEEGAGSMNDGVRTGLLSRS